MEEKKISKVEFDEAVKLKMHSRQARRLSYLSGRKPTGT